MGGRDEFSGLGHGSATREDVILRYAIAREQPYEHEVQERDGSISVTVAGPEQTAVTVTPGPEGKWCTCSEDAVPGTCTHVLFLLTLDAPIAATVRENLSRDRQLIQDEIEELRHQLTALEQQVTALEEIQRLLDSEGTTSR
jgi:hypothetical protein